MLFPKTCERLCFPELAGTMEVLEKKNTNQTNIVCKY